MDKIDGEATHSPADEIFNLEWVGCGWFLPDVLSEAHTGEMPPVDKMGTE